MEEEVNGRTGVVLKCAGGLIFVIRLLGEARPSERPEEKCFGSPAVNLSPSASKSYAQPASERWGQISYEANPDSFVAGGARLLAETDANPDGKSLCQAEQVK
jgi:hypothetical protein